MIKSMTGYGKAECTLSDNSKVTIEIRTLNGKNADISIKSFLVPKEKELSVRQFLTDRFHRGTIDVFINSAAASAATTAAAPQKTINASIFKKHFVELKNIAKELNIKAEGNSDTLIMSAVLKMPDVIESKSSEISEEDWKVINNAIEKAAEKTNVYRETEGKALYADVTKRISLIMEYLEEVKKEDVKRVPAVKERLKSKIGDLGIAADENRLEQEMVFYIEKLDINEEKVRLAQHCKYFMQTIDNEEFAGKKLGFILQEIGREINTMGSKANDAAIQKLVVKMKDELEKIREQSLNIL